MNKLLAILLAFGLVLSGCVVNTGYDVIMHPEKYEGQEVTITGHPLTVVLDFGYGTVLRYKLNAEDESGAPHALYMKHERFYCNTCTITGTIETMQGCNCIERSGTWETDLGLWLDVDKCNNWNANHWCENTRDIYYLNVTKVVKVD